MKGLHSNRILALTMAVAITLSCSACSGSTGTSSASAGGPSTASASKESGSAKENTTITYLASQGWVMDPEKELGKKFEEKTGIKVDYQVVPANQYSQVLLTKLNSGTCADIFGGQSGKFDIATQYNVEKNAVDLSNEKWISTFDSASKDELSVNGKCYGLMIWDTAPLYPIMYNKQIFSKTGCTVPKTYAEFKADCDKIKNSGVTPIYECGSDGWHMTLWFLDIGPVYAKNTSGLVDNLNNNKAKFAGNKTMLTALNELSEMKKNGYFGANFLSQPGSNTEQAMGGGKFAMVLAGLNEPAAVEKAVPTMKADNFGFFEIPLADNQTLCYSPCGPSKFIYSGSQHVKEAKEYFDFLTEPDNLQYFLNNDSTKVSLCFSGVKDTMSSAAKEFVNSYKDKGIYLQNQTKYVNPQWGDIEKDLTSMYIGQITPDQILQNIDKRRATQAKAAKDSLWS